MFFSDNIKLLRKRKRRTQDDVSRELGLKRSTLSGYENGIAEPGIDVLIKFSKYYKVAIDTLLKVELSKLSISQLEQLERGYDVYKTGSKLRILATTVNEQNDENIELVSEKAKAGYARGYADPSYIQDLPRFTLPFLSPQRKYRTFQLSGDSMLPIPDKSWVTAEYIQDWNTIIDGYAYVVFTFDDGIMFKIVENKISEEGKLTLYSLNPVYEPYDVLSSDVKEVWKFVNYISNQIPDPIMPKDHLYSTIAKVKYDVDKLKSRLKS